MREDIIIQIRRILPFTVCVLAVIVVCDISTTAYAEKWSSVTLVASMVHLLAWCAIVGVAAVRIFRCFNGGNDYLLLLARGNRFAGAVPLAVAWGLAIWICFMIDAPFRLIDVPSTGQRALQPGQLAFWICSRSASIVAFILLALCISAFAGHIRRTSLAAIAATIVYLAATVGQGVALFKTMSTSRPDLTWGIGYNTAFNGVSQYANIMPIMMWDPQDPDVAATLYSPTLWSNVGLAVVMLALWLVVVPRLRISFIK